MYINIVGFSLKKKTPIQFYECVEILRVVYQTHINDESTELELFWSDDLMVARLLSQFQDCASCCEPQSGHVRLTIFTNTNMSHQRQINHMYIVS